MTMNLPTVDTFEKETKCFYKGEKYSVRDNGAVLRHSKDERRPRPSDKTWTFGKPNNKTGYMEIASARVHRIVATAFHGEPPTKEHVVDHIDTNKRNNRPENLRWVTRLENVLLNPITIKKIESVCGCSVEEFLRDPSKFRDEFQEPNFSWMCTVSKEAAAISLERLQEWAASDNAPSGGALGDWIFSRNSYYQRDNPQQIDEETPNILEHFKTPQAKPRDFIAEITSEIAAATNERIYKTAGEIMGLVQDLLKSEPSLMLPDLKLDLCGGYLLIENAHLKKFDDVEFVFEGRAGIPKFGYLTKGQLRLGAVVKIKGFNNYVAVENIPNELGVIEIDLTWAKAGITEATLRKLLTNESKKLVWLSHSNENQSKINETAEKLLTVCEPTINTLHGRKHAQVVCPVSSTGECGVLDCIYCEYRFSNDDNESGGCFGKSRIETYEDLLSVVDVKRQDEQIISITYNKNGKSETKKFEFLDPNLTLGKSLLTLWNEKKGTTLTAVNKRNDWCVLLENDPNESLKEKGEVYARLARNVSQLPISGFRSIWGYADKDWEVVDT